MVSRVTGAPMPFLTVSGTCGTDAFFPSIEASFVLVSCRRWEHLPGPEGFRRREKAGLSCVASFARKCQLCRQPHRGKKSFFGTCRAPPTAVSLWTPGASGWGTTMMRAPKILYIEDDAGSRTLVRRILEDAGYVVREAVDGLSGIEAALREQPALILLDIGLPGIDGYTVAAALSAFPNLARVPIIA